MAARNAEKSSTQLGTHLGGDAFLDKIVEKYFQEFIDYEVTRGTDEQQQAKLKQAMLGDFRDHIDEFSRKYLTKEPQLSFTESLPIDPDNRYSDRRLLEILEAVILDQPTRDLLKLNRPVATFILICIQSQTLEIPFRVYGYEHESLLEKAKNILVQIIKHVEEIRSKYRLPSQITISEHKLMLRSELQAVTRLHQQIARVKNQIWLPMRPLITAPLSGEELDYYARDTSLAKRLARQIVRNDGVILVSGYRGAGKSTLINLVLENEAFVPQMEKLQQDDARWKIVPVRISLAKATNVKSVLRICIRALYNQLVVNKDALPYLRQDELRHISMAYARVSYRFSQEQEQTFSRSASADAELSAELASLIAKPAQFPLPKLTAKYSREWNRKLNQTVGLLEYDEDRAEEDIVALIDKLVRLRYRVATKNTAILWRIPILGTIVRNIYGDQRVNSDLLNLHIPSGSQSASQEAKIPRYSWLRRRKAAELSAPLRPFRIKLVFVFDEMDKMDEDEGQIPLIKQLKNLFLTRNGMFILLTSKKFYYRWLSERRQEDSLLNSYFSSVVTVPLFTSVETRRLLEHMISADDLTDNEKSLVLAYARYLTYKAAGVPREIIRALESLQEWMVDSLQPYLSDRSSRIVETLVYAEIQAALENLTNYGSSPPTWGDTEGAGFMSGRMRTDDSRREQIKRGYYIILEELLTYGELAWEKSLLNDEKGNLYSLYVDNFQMVSKHEFLTLLDQLANRLDLVQINLDSPAFSRVRTQIGNENYVQLFEREAQESSIKVSNAFYQLTGRYRDTQASPSSRAISATAGSVMKMDIIAERLNSSSVADKLRAMSHLQRSEEPRTEAVQAKLSELFSSSQTPPSLRIESATVIEAAEFFKFVDSENIKKMIKDEIDPQVLKTLLNLFQDATAETSGNNLKKLVGLLIPILDRGLIQTKSQGLSNELYTDVLTFFIREGRRLNLFEHIVERLDGNYTFERGMFFSLMRVSHMPLEKFLIKMVYYDNLNVPPEVLNEFLNLSDLNLLELWKGIYVYKGSDLGKKVLAQVLVRLPRFPRHKELILQWLSSAEWTIEDTRILRHVFRKDVEIEYVLEAIAKQNELATQRLEQAGLRSRNNPYVVTTNAPDTSGKSRSFSIPKQKTPNVEFGVLITLIAYGLYATLLPYDLPANASLANEIGGRVLETIYMHVGLASILTGVVTVFDSNERGSTGFTTLVLAVIALGSYLALTLWLLHPVTWRGQAIIFGANAGLWATYYIAAEIGKIFKRKPESNS